MDDVSTEVAPRHSPNTPLNNGYFSQLVSPMPLNKYTSGSTSGKSLMLKTIIIGVSLGSRRVVNSLKESLLAVRASGSESAINTTQLETFSASILRNLAIIDKLSPLYFAKLISLFWKELMRG